LEKIHERALENSHKAAMRNELRWNRKAKPEVFEEGEEVWVKDDTKKNLQKYPWSACTMGTNSTTK